MALFLAVGVGLVAWPLVFYTHPNLLSQVHFGDATLNKGNVITPQLSTFIENTLALEHINGLSVTVVPKYGEPEFHTWGYRTEDGDRVTPDTLFHMASVSKAFCATAMGLLIDDFEHGRNVTALPPGVTELTWHTRLKDVLPEWELMDEWASERANLKDILSHVSGVPRHGMSFGPGDTPRDLIARLKHLRPAFELREQFSYTSIMYMIASHVITMYSGQSYTSFVKDRIFTPLNMTSSTFFPAEAEATGKFTQGWTKDGRLVPECLDQDMSLLLAGAGGVISNAVDMSNWIAAWVNEGVHKNQTAIPPHVYKNTSRSYSISDDRFKLGPGYSIVGYGMGWSRNSYLGHDVVYHLGGLPGCSTLVSFLPSDEFGVALFANGDNKETQLISILDRIIESALHLSSPPAPARSPSPNVTTTNPRVQETIMSLDTFAGTYTNPGYGSIALCGPSSSSPYCAHVRSDFSVVDRVLGNENPSGDLLAEWPRLCKTHVRLRHEQGLVFRLYLTTLYPNGHGKNTTPFEASDVGGVVEFVVEDGDVVGFGMSGTVGELTERERRGGRVRDRAETWFDRT